MSHSSSQSTRTSPGSYSTTQRTPSVSSGASPPHQSLPSSQPPASAQNAMTTDVFSPTTSQTATSVAPTFSNPFAALASPPSLDGVSPAAAAAMRPGDSDRSMRGRMNGFMQPTIPSAILIRKLPQSSDHKALRTMLLFAKGLVEADFVDLDLPEERGFKSAIARFTTVDAAERARQLLDGQRNSADDADMVAELYHYSGPLGAALGPRRNTIDHTATTRNFLGGMTSNGPVSRQSSRFNGTFQSLATNQSGPSAGDAALPADNNSRMHTLFSPKSPIGNGIHDLPRISGKSMIDQDLDEDTGELLKDPVGYAENGHSTSAFPRRSTNPPIPTSQLAGLSLGDPISSPPLSGYNPNGAHMGMPNPAAYPPAMGHPMGSNAGPPFGNPLAPRHSLPAANPNDMNPPCNTLYVGNLPGDTQEEELKCLFSKQRGYKRLCFRNKANGPMCFVEFDDVGTAGKALNELYGFKLSNSLKTGIRLSFSKNPLGVRGPSSQSNSSNTMSQPAAGPGGNSLGGMHNHMFSAVTGPPPGLTPPGLAPMSLRNNGSVHTTAHRTGMPPNVAAYAPNPGLGIRNSAAYPLVAATPPLNGGGSAGNPGPNMESYNSFYPDYMMGR